MNENIFVQIAAYRDPELVPTLRNLFNNALYPNNLKVCIAWQRDENDTLEEFEKDSRINLIKINYKDSKGACWARNLIQQHYTNETYTLQLDSHHRFIKNWDKELIDMFKILTNKGIKKPLLTSYISSYNPKNDPADRVLEPWKMNFDKFIPEGAVFFLPATIENHTDLKEPIPARFYSAHFAFTIGEFCKEVPHDPNYYFHGEEISIAVRAYTHGYDLFHPHKIIAWHEYTRQGRTKHWDDCNKWGELNTNCHLRNRKLFGMDGLINDIDFGIYGFGNIRTLRDYEKYAGINFSKRSVQQYTLNNSIAPNPYKYSTEEEWENSFTRNFKYCVNIIPQDVPEKDYQFWCVAFKDENDQEIYRKDADKTEILNLFNGSNPLSIWREFNSYRVPVKCVIWPYSTSKGWCDKIEKIL